MEYLIKKKLLQLIDPRPPPYSLPYRYNQVEHYEYHQTPGHTLDRCFHLKHDIQDLNNEGKVSFDPTPTNPQPTTNIIQNPLPNHQPSKGVNMIGLTSTQFDPASNITKISKPKKVIFLPDFNQVSTINGYYLEPIASPEHEHLFAHMWETTPDSTVIVLPPDINIFGEGSVTHDPFFSPHIIPPPSLSAQLTNLSSPSQIINIPPPTRI